MNTPFMTYKEENEQLRAQVTLLQQQVTESKARVIELEKERDAAISESRVACIGLNDYFGKQIAAQQLVIEKMREALQMLDRVSNISCGKVQEAIALQPSTEALDAYVAEKVKAENAAMVRRLEIMHEDMKGQHNYYLVAANVIHAKSDKENKK